MRKKVLFQSRYQWFAQDYSVKIIKRDKEQITSFGHI